MDTSNQKSITVAIIGAPNAGKSTLVNKLVGSKVSIVSPKEQTTRTSLRGIAMYENTQIILVDTPGIFRPDKALDKAMVRSAWRALDEADCYILLVDAHKAITDKVRDIIEGLNQRKLPVILVLNKVDMITPEILLPLSVALHNLFDFEKTFMISALKGKGTNDILRYLGKKAEVQPWAYPADEITTAPMRFMAAETTREQIFYKLNDELPYSTYVETDAWEEKKDGSVKVNQTIYVLRESHKAIIVGKAGAMLKDIGARARAQMAKDFGFTVHLFLFVKVKEDWQTSPESFAAIGLEE